MSNAYKYFSYRTEWLCQHGGRDEADILEDEYGEYVMMRCHRRDSKIYLPFLCQKYPVIHRTSIKMGDSVNKNEGVSVI